MVQRRLSQGGGRTGLLVEAVRAFRRPGAVLLVTALGAVCVLVVSGCGSSAASTTPATSTSSTSSATTGTPTTGTTTTGTSTTAGSFTAYQTCLQQHGVTFPQGRGFGGGFGRRGGGAGGGAAGGDEGTTGTTATGTIGAGAGNAGAGGAAGGGAGERPRPALTAAQQKALADCASLRPTGGFGRGGGFGGGFNSNDPAYAKFEACLKDHGVQTGSPGGGASTAARAAFTACRSLLPAGGRFGGGAGGAGGGSGTGTTSSTFTAFQACLKQHGVQTGAAGQTPAKTQAAIAACRSLLPNGGNGATTTGTTTTTG